MEKRSVVIGLASLLIVLVAFFGVYKVLNLKNHNGAGNNLATVITPDGASIKTYSGTGAFPHGIAFDGTNMWTANFYGNSVTKVTPEGNLFGFGGTGTNPAAIAFDKTNMWVANTNSNSVSKVAPDGTMTTFQESELVLMV
jgi:hypothetical protein